MALKLRDIRALGEDRYEVTFEDEAGGAEPVVCQVVTHDGVQGIQMNSELVKIGGPLRIDIRAVVRQVLDLHNQRGETASANAPNGQDQK
jgi:hypothetical protein